MASEDRLRGHRWYSLLDRALTAIGGSDQIAASCTPLAASTPSVRRCVHSFICISFPSSSACSWLGLIVGLRSLNSR
jgi:hypothetical protein